MWLLKYWIVQLIHLLYDHLILWNDKFVGVIEIKHIDLLFMGLEKRTRLWVLKKALKQTGYHEIINFH